MSVPKYWTETSLRSLILAQKGKKPLKLKKSRFPNSIPYLDIETLEKQVNIQYADSLSSVLATNGDLFIVWDGSRSGLIFETSEKIGAVASTIMKITTISINKNYLFRFLQYRYDFFRNNTVGDSIPHINPELFFSLSIPLPPVQEQERIVFSLTQKLEEFKNEIIKHKKEIDALENYRQSVLERAVSGELTEDWREEKQLDIEKDWASVALGEIITFIGSGATPLGGNSNYTTTGVPFIRSQNVYPNRLIMDDIVYIPDNIHQKMKRSQLKPYDVLLNITGASIGRVAVVPKDFEEGNVNQHVCIIRVENVIIPHYLSLFLNSSIGQNIIMGLQSGMTRQGLNYSQIRSISIFYPKSIKEQSEIVSRVEKLLQKADEAEAKYKEAMKYIEKLQQSVLEMAFRGELSESQSDDEPVSVLLERIKIEKVKMEKERKELSTQQIKNKKNMINQENIQKSILDLLKEAPNQTLTVEQVWQSSPYFKDKEVELFYEEIQRLKNEGKLVNNFIDNKHKIETNLTLIADAN